MILYLIRHGKTIANEQHLYCGSTNLPLSPSAVAELKARSGMELPPYTRLISSGMKRCNETLEILFHSRDYEMISEFREIDFGIFEMKSYEQLKENPEYLTWIVGDNFQNIPPDGESGAQMHARIIPALETILHTDRNTAIVTHGGVIAAIMQHLFSEENKNMYEWQPKPG